MFVNTLLKKNAVAHHLFLSNVHHQARHFARYKPPSLEIPEEFIQKEKQAFEQLVSQRERTYMHIQRLAHKELGQDSTAQDKLWWNKVATLTEDDMEMLPLSFTMKYGTFVQKITENSMIANVQHSRNFEDRYERVRLLDRLKTKSELEEIEKMKEENEAQPRNDYDNYEKPDYMKRQPRVDLRAVNFNFEQYRPYIDMYEEARVKDEADSKNFYKLVKYVLARRGTDEERTNSIVKEFLKKYHIDLIEIPEEFKNLQVEDDFKPVKRGRTAPKRKRVLTKSNKSLAGYDVWRSFDRRLLQFQPNDPGCCNIMVPPALLKRAFGQPQWTDQGFAVSGIFDFEDSNLDMYRVFDYKKTDLYHGLPREESFYTTESNMRRHEKTRKRVWPTQEEFWELQTPVEFRVICSPKAEWRKFRKWLFRHLRMIEADPEFDYDKIALEKYADQKDISVGDFEEKGKLNHEMAIYKWDASIYMTEEEIAALPEERRPVLSEPPKYFDLSKAERIVIKKDEMQIQEIQAQQEKLSSFV